MKKSKGPQFNSRFKPDATENEGANGAMLAGGETGKPDRTGWVADQVPHREPTAFVPPVPAAPITEPAAAASAAAVGPAPRRHGPKVSVFISILFIPLLRSTLHA